MRLYALGAACLLVTCTGPVASDRTPEALYFERLAELCNGKAYAGELVSSDEVDADFRDARMIMGPARCDRLTVRIPFTIDEDGPRSLCLSGCCERKPSPMGQGGWSPTCVDSGCNGHQVGEG
ncbi:MAG: hypothetical protein AAGB16_01715, partial [Pseudomonadota bacterium]